MANHYKVSWVPEFARDYIDGLGRPYSYDDILIIAKEQFSRNESKHSDTGPYLFCDTELIVTKIWCEFKYGKCHPWIKENIKKQHFDLYLLTDIDLLWQPDEQREHPLQRKELFELYIKELVNLNFPFKIISGTGNKRLRNAVLALSLAFENI
ncbi:MAG: ATP-binding protein [Bacteroidales bacterium]